MKQNVSILIGKSVKSLPNKKNWHGYYLKNLAAIGRKLETLFKIAKKT